MRTPRVKFLLPAFAAAALLSPRAVRADDAPSQETVTYSKDVAPILFKNCATCHRPGEGSPMTLLSYQETRPWVKSIKASVAKREMPPWDADPAHGEWANDLRLTDGEIATIVKWVDQGAPEGDPSLTPPAPPVVEGWRLGEPDYVIELDEVEIPAEGNDLFPNLEVTVNIGEKRWLRALEVRAGDLTVLHHVVLFTSGIGMASAAGSFDALAVWAVGTPPVIYPEGMGRWVNPNMKLTANMHYHPSGKAAKDKTRVGLYFGEGELKKEITSALAGTISINIPPHAEDYRLSARYYVNQDIQLVSLFPHMHMRGRRMSFTANYPDGRKETLLDVPNYDFNWQWFYYPKNPKILPADTEIEINAQYDNSANNPNNPDPSATITFGEQSQEEMMFGFLEFVPVEGAKPKPLNAKKLLAKIASKLPEGEAYNLDMNMGFMRMNSLMHLPRAGGKGLWYFAFGGSVMPVDLDNLAWNGDDFTFDMEFMGGRFGMNMVAKGKVDAAGNIAGEFDMKPESAERAAEREKMMAELGRTRGAGRAESDKEEGEGDRPHRRRGGGGGGFLRDFKGTRFVPAAPSQPAPEISQAAETAPASAAP